jgi:predicted acyltransferase
VIKRTILIFAIGLFLNWWPFARWQDDRLLANGWTWLNGEGKEVGVRIFGVLQRIAVCYFFASVLIYYLKARGAFLAGLILLLLYWLYCVAGNPADPYSLAGWAGTDVDKRVLGELHMYKGEGVTFDPEGLMSTIPAIVQVIFGYLVGAYIINRGSNTATTTSRQHATVARREAIPAGDAVLPPTSIDGEKEKVLPAAAVPAHLYPLLTGLFIIAMAFLFSGYAWGLSFPVNKKIWTSSYTVLTTGMAIAVLATLIYAIEVKGMRGWWTRFFDVFGKNALFVFALSAFLPKGLRLIRIPNGVNDKGIAQYVSPWSWLYEKVYKYTPGAPEIGSLLFALTVILFMWAICYWLDKKRIYIKV